MRRTDNTTIEQIASESPETHDTDRSATWESLAPRIAAIWAGAGQRADSRKAIFTIVTPTYNCAATIDQTIQSVVTQIGRFSIQYVIVDGLSTDGTVDRIKHWQASLDEGNVKVECDAICLKYICEKDEGLYDAIEKGFRNCDYQDDALNVMTWINGDDFLTQGALATVCQVYSENDSVQWLTGIRQIFDNLKGMITPTAAMVYPKYFLANGLCDGTHFPFLQQEGTFWTYELYKKVGGLDPKLSLAGDYDLWRRFGQEEHLLVIDNVLGVFRKQPGQKSENIDEYKKEINACMDFDDRASKFYEICYKSERKIEEGVLGKKASFSYGEGRWLFHDVSLPFKSLPRYFQEIYWKYRIARRSSEEASTLAASSPDTSHRVEAKPNSARDLGARAEGRIGELEEAHSRAKDEPARIPTPSGAAWEPVDGFGPREGHDAPHSLPHFRWLVRPTGEVRLDWHGPDGTPVLLKLKVRNREAHQSLNLVLNEQDLGVFSLEADDFGNEQVIVVEASLKAGSNSLFMSASRCRYGGDGGRMLALIVTDILVAR